MILPEIDRLQITQIEHKFKPTIFSRVLAFVIDYFIFAPVISFLTLMLFRQGLSLYKNYPQSDEAQLIFYYLIVGFVFLITLLQAIFITFWRGTPGQHVLKLEVEFHKKSSMVFLQAWFRQIGFVASFFLLGLPFLSVLFDEDGRCFYDKMVDAKIISLVPNSNETKTGFKYYQDLDKKFWSSSMTTLSLFLIAISIILFWKSYSNILQSPIAYKKYLKHNPKICQDFADLNTTDRLRYKIAMNLVGTISDDCLNQEADFVLWRNFTTDQSLAYFAKFIAASDKSDLEAKYLYEACRLSDSSEGCYWSQIFINREFNKIVSHSDYGQSVLGQVLSYEMNTDLNSHEKSKIIKKVQLQSKEKSIQKFVIIESLNLQSNSKMRSPASQNESNDDVNSVIDMIRDL